MTNIRRLQQAARKRILAADDVNVDNIEEYVDIAIEAIEKWLKRNKLGKLEVGDRFKDGDGWYTKISFTVSPVLNLICDGGFLIEKDGVCFAFLGIVIGDNKRSDGVNSIEDGYVVRIDLDKKKVTDIAMQ